MPKPESSPVTNHSLTATAMRMYAGVDDQLSWSILAIEALIVYIHTYGETAFA
jgi:hypothetical protein